MLAAYSSHFEAALAAVQPSKSITLDIDPKITGGYRVHCEDIFCNFSSTYCQL